MIIQKLKVYKTAKNEFGLCTYKGNKCFYKIKKNMYPEIDGYKKMQKYYKTPELLNYNCHMAIYKYEEELTKNTLHEYLYFDSEINLKEVVKPYYKSFEDKIILDEKLSKNVKFFSQRCQNIKNIIGCEYIINEVKKVLLQPKKLTCFITQGDPTDTNISCKGMYTDFENAGYNTVVGEIAIIYASFITHGGYFYPKYNPQAYDIRPNKLDYSKNNLIIKNMAVPTKNKNLMMKFIEPLLEDKNVEEEIKNYLKYYIIMRMLTPIELCKMTEEDNKMLKKHIKRLYECDFNKKRLLEIVDGKV